MIIIKKKNAEDSKTLKEVVFTAENETDKRILTMLANEAFKIADMIKLNGTGSTAITSKVQIDPKPRT